MLGLQNRKRRLGLISISSTSGFARAVQAGGREGGVGVGSCLCYVPLHDICGALRHPTVNRVAPRGVYPRASRARDSQFVSKAPFNAELSRAGSSHRAAAHGQTGDHRRAACSDIVERHRAI